MTQSVNLAWEYNQQRFAEILAAHDSHNNAIQALRSELGLDQAEALADELCDVETPLFDEILGVRAFTMAGLSAKVQAAWREDCDNEKLMRSILEDLITINGVTA